LASTDSRTLIWHWISITSSRTLKYKWRGVISALNVVSFLWI
jgi:hypothetical protein